MSGPGAARPDPYHTREGRDEKVRYADWKCASRPPHTREGRDEKVRYGGLCGVQTPTTHKRRQRARR
jgi:hypothetical protein